MDVPMGTSAVLELQAGRVRRIGPLRPEDFAALAARAREAVPRRSAVRPRAAAGPPLRHKPDVVAVRRHAETVVPPRGALLITLSDVDLYVGYRAVLEDINWQLRAGEQWSVFGANGAGKSSFLKLLYGDLSPAYGGRIERSGYAQGTPISEWKRHVGFVSPELQSTYAVDVSIEELVASGRHASIGLVDAPAAADLKTARHWIAFFRLTSVAQRRPRELSYGQLRRALIARAMAADPRILLLDEPLTGLDPKQRALMKRLLARLMQQGITLVAAVHHPEDLPRGMTHGLRLSRRRAHPVDAYSAN
jgi:molybdate transport system ATP-binding protein